MDGRPLLRPRALAHGDAAGGAAISNGAAILLLHRALAWAAHSQTRSTDVNNGHCCFGSTVKPCFAHLGHFKLADLLVQEKGHVRNNFYIYVHETFFSPLTLATSGSTPRSCRRCASPGSSPAVGLLRCEQKHTAA